MLKLLLQLLGTYPAFFRVCGELESEKMARKQIYREGIFHWKMQYQSVQVDMEDDVCDTSNISRDDIPVL